MTPERQELPRRAVCQAVLYRKYLFGRDKPLICRVARATEALRMRVGPYFSFLFGWFP